MAMGMTDQGTGGGLGSGGLGGGDLLDTSGIAQVRAYWEALRDGESVPSRARIDPRGIAGALDRAFLIERLAPGLAQFRIAGMACNRLFGMEARGLPFSNLFLTEARLPLQIGLERVFAGPGMLHLWLRAERRAGRTETLARMDLLPLLNHAGQCTMALGCLALPEDAISEGNGPETRFAIRSSRFDLLAGPERVAPPAAALSAPLRPARAHLRLVHSAG